MEINMLKNTKRIYKKMIIIMAVTILFFSPILFVKFEDNEKLMTGSTIKLDETGIISLSYGDYYSASGYASLRIRWSFDSSNTYVGITVIAMDAESYALFLALESYSYYTLSNGNYRTASGTFTVPQGGDWYVLFMNFDSDHQTTYLTFDVTFIGISPLVIILAVIIIIAVIGTILGIVLGTRKKRRAKKMAIKQNIIPDQPKAKPTSSQIDQTQSQNTNWVSCPNCGEKSVPGTKFCAYCGIEMNISKS
jgi:hypothetical protein